MKPHDIANFKHELTRMFAAKGRPEPAPLTLSVWAEDCMEHDFMTVADALMEYRRGEDEFPSVGKVLAICKRLEREAERQRMADMPSRLIAEEKAKLLELEHK